MSAANVAQLAVDLLIASLSLRSVGVFDSRDLVPIVSAREDGEEGVSTPLEREPRRRSFLLIDYSDRTDRYFPAVFGKEGCGIVVVQQRSPVLLVRVCLAFRAAPLTRISSSRENRSLSMHFSTLLGNRGFLRSFFYPASTCLTGRMHK